MSRGVKLIRGSAVKMSNFLLSVVISFYLMPFLVRSLGDSTYGLWSLVGEFLGYYGLLDIGFSAAVLRFISRAVGRGDHDDVRRTVATAFYLFSTLALLTVACTVTLSFFLDAFMTQPENIRLFRILLFMLGINFAVDFPVRTFSAVITSNLRDDLGTAISVVKNVFCAITIVFVVNAGHGILGLAVTSVAFSLADSAARVILAFRLDPRTTIRFRYVDKSKLRPLFNYSSISFVGKIANILRFRLDQVIISAFVGLSAVTHYYVATRLIDYLTNLIAQGIGVITPFFSQEEGRKNYAGIRSKFMLVSKISVFISVFFCGLSAIYGRPFIDRWMGAGYDDSAMILWIFLIPFTLHLIQSPAYPLLDGTSKHRYYAIPNLVEGILNLALSLTLVRRYGMAGVAIGTAVPMTLKLLTVQPYLVCRAMQMPLRQYAFQTIKLTLYAGLFLGAGWIAVRHAIRPDYAAIVGCAAAQSLIFWPLAVFAGFTAHERKDLFGWVKKAASPRAAAHAPAPAPIKTPTPTPPEPALAADKV